MKTLVKSAMIEVGRLVSTTDLKLAVKLGQLVSIAELTGGRNVNPERVDSETVLITVGSELHYLAVA